MSLMKRVMEAKHQKKPIAEPTFAEKREAWLDAAHRGLTKKPEPTPHPDPHTDPRPAPAPKPVTGPRGSCKAVNIDTGRQCALLGGHTGVHRHGRTEFIRTAALGQTSFARRDTLDGLASSRHGSSFTTPATGD